VVSPTVTLVYHFFIFPLFGLFATSGMIFSASKGGRNNLARLKRKNTLTSGEEDFCASLAAECRHWHDWDWRLPLRKNSIHGRLHGSRKR